MSRLDRYYIPAGVPARPPAPPLPKKGILMLPPPPLPPNGNAAGMVPAMSHRFPSSQPPMKPVSNKMMPQGNWSYQANPHYGPPPKGGPPGPPKNMGPAGMPDMIRPRRPLPRVHNNMIMVDYEELPSSNLASAMTLPDSSGPRLALQRILYLYENGEHREAANFMRRLNFVTFKSILPQLPADIFIESMPHSLPILEALYAKLFLQSTKADALICRANSLRPEAVVWQLVKFFASQEEELQPAGQMRWEFCGPFISSCKRLLTVLLAAEPRARRVLHERKKALMKAIEGLGQHGLVGTSDGGLVYLHLALKHQFEKVQKSYEGALEKLENLNGQTKLSIQTNMGNKAPIAQSHQRQLSLKAQEIQERLIKNKTLLNVIEPTLENTSLEVLLGILQQRIELDKECLFQFTQVKKESALAKTEQSVAPILMRYQRGCQQVLDLMKEVTEDKDVDEEDGGTGSDISGYHSDSESAVMTSGNSPFISKEARYSFLSRSVRLGSKHNVRASILASSLCLDSASLRGGSIKSHSLAGSVIAHSLTGRRSLSEGRRPVPGPPSLVIHSSSGVSSGSTSSDTASNEDKNGPGNGPHSPTPSSSSSQGTVKRSPNSATNSVISNNVNNKNNENSVKSSGVNGQLVRPRHLKQRKEVFKGSSSVNGSTLGSVKSCCHRCGTRSTAASATGTDQDTGSTINGSEPVYQGIIERDISVIRKETELASLKSELAKIKNELSQAQKTVFTLEDSEKMLRERLADEKHRSLTLEKMASLQKQKNLPKVNGGYSALDERPAHLVRRYGELYSQLRLETLDALDKLKPLVNSDELKIKLLFSVVVLAFRSVTNSISSKRDQIRRILQLPPPGLATAPSSSSSSPADCNGTPADQGSEKDPIPSIQDHDLPTDGQMLLEPAVKDLEEAVTAYLRRATETFDLSKNVEEVCSQIWATLYDYPCLKTCDGIIKYVKECVRVAWGLVNQVPVYVIEYEARQFRPDLHVRYHNSDPENDTIKTYLWPALLEGQNGPCVQRGVVIT